MNTGPQHDDADTEGLIASTGRGILVDWANDQDEWLRGLVAEVLQTRQALPEDAIKAHYESFLHEKELGGQEPAARIAALDAGTTANEQGRVLRLQRLYDLSDVNALAEEQSLAFNDRMTIVFGENATGKTGYVRVIKSLAAVRSIERVLPDVRGATTSAEPEAQVEYRVDEENKTIRWRGQEGVRPLTAVTVFDAQAVQLHLDADLTYEYTPADLALFKHVHDGVESVRGRLNEEIGSRNPSRNPFLHHFDRGTNIYPKIESLGAATDLDELRRLADVEEDSGTMRSLEEKAEALGSRSPKDRAAVASAERDLFASVSEVARAIVDFDAVEHNRLVAKREDIREAHEQVARGAFTTVELPGLLSPSWEAFVRAADAYTREHVAHDPGGEGDACVYCRQPLAKEAAELVRKYSAFIHSRHQDDLVAVETDLAKVRPVVRDPAPIAKRLRGARASRKEEADLDPLFEACLGLLEAVPVLLRDLDAMRPVSVDDLRDRARSVSEIAGQRAEQAEELAQAAIASATEREEELGAVQKRLVDLRAALTLKRFLEDIVRHVENAKWAARAEQIGTAFRPMLKGLTEASKRAAEKLLNRDFERAFRVECEALRAPVVELAFPGRRGQSARKKTVGGQHRLHDILSEGELKVIALADFLGEASLKSGVSPIVLDDPVTSLDYRRLRYVVARLAEISASRQVIVFTHNIWFATELLSRFEKMAKECSFYNVEERDERKGVLMKGAHPRVDTVKTLARRINTLIQDAGTAADETRSALVESAYSVIRSWCEVVVETELLQGVTQRYQPHVRMTVLPQIKGDRISAAVGVIVPIFENACRATEAHSQPLETLNVRPTLEGLKADWADLARARQAYNE